jgi:hypothetical protein
MSYSGGALAVSLGAEDDAAERRARTTALLREIGVSLLSRLRDRRSRGSLAPQ